MGALFKSWKNNTYIAGKDFTWFGKGRRLHICFHKRSSPSGCVKRQVPLHHNYWLNFIKIPCEASFANEKRSLLVHLGYFTQIHWNIFLKPGYELSGFTPVCKDHAKEGNFIWPQRGFRKHFYRVLVRYRIGLRSLWRTVSFWPLEEKMWKSGMSGKGFNVTEDECSHG